MTAPQTTVPRRAGALIDDAFLFVCCVAALLASRRPFPDPDLGWHLAGGLWMLETQSIPQQDPFGTTGAFWLCYSWLPELIYGAAYRMGAFAAIHVLEILTFISVAAFAVLYVRRLSRSNAAQANAGARLSEWLTTAILLFFLLPTCSLRPQVISWVFLGLLIVLIRAARLSVAALLTLTLLWVNSHTYWIVVPFVVCLTAVLAPSASLSRTNGVLLTVTTVAMGLVNPYGWKNFGGIAGFLFDQDVSSRLMFELAPLTVWHEAFPLFVGILAGIALCGRRLIAREGLAPVLLCVLLAAEGARALKSLPLFAIAAAPLLVRGVFPELLAWMGRQHRHDTLSHWSASDQRWMPQWVLRLAMVAVLAIVTVGELYARPFLRSPHHELLSIAERLERDERFRNRGRVHVLSDTNYGGWLELALWLARPARAGDSRFRVAIDNRGLVTGEQRFDEYDRLRQMHGDWRGTIDRWEIDIAILPTQATIVDALVRPASATGSKPWDLLSTTAIWTVLARPDVALSTMRPRASGGHANAS